MNGKKILNRLIGLFLVINVVLVIANYVNKGNEYVLSQERIDNIITRLEQKGIQIETELIQDYSPKYRANVLFRGDNVTIRDQVAKKFFGNNFGHVKRSTTPSKESKNRSILYYTYDEETLAFNHTKLTYQNEEIGMEGMRPSLDYAKSMCDQLITRIHPQGQTLTYHVSEEAYNTYWKLTYYPLINEIPLLDSYMEFIVANSGVMKADMYLAEVEVQKNSKQAIYAVDLVLFGIEDYMLENGYTNIKDIEICYKYEQGKENVLGQAIIPMYKITIDGLEEAIYVNAYTNKMLEYHA